MSIRKNSNQTVTSNAFPSSSMHTEFLLQTSTGLFFFNPKESGLGYVSWNPDKAKDLKYPPHVPNVNFFKGLLFNGMGSFRAGSELYLVGGDRVKNGIYQLPKTPNRSPTDIFQSRFSSDEPLVELTDTIPRMKAGKSRPVVEVIDGKIFVHSSMGVLDSRLDNPDPVFEYYDPHKGYWEGVPNVPYATKKSNGLVVLDSYAGFGHFVIGSRLFIPSGVKDIHCFDASTMKWDYKIGSNLCASFNEAGLVQLPMFGKCISGLGLGDGYNVMVCLQGFGRFITPKPYAYLIDKNVRLVCYQDLSEEQQLFNDFLPYVEPRVESRFDDLGSGKLCAFLYGQNKGKSEVVLHICIFEFQKLPAAVDDIVLNPPPVPIEKDFSAGDDIVLNPPIERNFLTVKVLNKFFCKLTGLVDYKPASLVNAFVL